MEGKYWRLLAACGVFSAWMVLLFAGRIFGGGLHLLLVGAVALVPWRSLRAT